VDEVGGELDDIAPPRADRIERCPDIRKDLDALRVEVIGPNDIAIEVGGDLSGDENKFGRADPRDLGVLTERLPKTSGVEDRDARHSRFPEKSLLDATQAIVGEAALDRGALCRIFCAILAGCDDRGKLILRRGLSGSCLPLPKLGGSAGRRYRIPCCTGGKTKHNKKRDPSHPHIPKMCRKLYSILIGSAGLRHFLIRIPRMKPRF
jgi:hypothetical protein